MKQKNYLMLNVFDLESFEALHQRQILKSGNCVHGRVTFVDSMRPSECAQGSERRQLT
jgi:hypothetical protein